MSGCHPSTTKRTPDGVSPRSSRSASPAWIAPTMAEAALRITAVSHVGSLPRGGVGLRPVYIRFGVERLPLEIRELDDVSIDEPKVPNPRPGKQVGGDASQGPQTDHDGSCPGELSLALYTNLRKDFLSTISIG